MLWRHWWKTYIIMFLMEDIFCRHNEKHCYLQSWINSVLSVCENAMKTEDRDESVMKGILIDSFRHWSQEDNNSLTKCTVINLTKYKVSMQFTWLSKHILKSIYFRVTLQIPTFIINRRFWIILCCLSAHSLNYKKKCKGKTNLWNFHLKEELWEQWNTCKNYFNILIWFISF